MLHHSQASVVVVATNGDSHAGMKPVTEVGQGCMYICTYVRCVRMCVHVHVHVCMCLETREMLCFSYHYFTLSDLEHHTGVPA